MLACGARTAAHCRRSQLPANMESWGVEVDAIDLKGAIDT